MQRRMPSGQGPARRSGPRAVSSRGEFGRRGEIKRGEGGRRGDVSRPALARRGAAGAGAGGGAAQRTSAPQPRRFTGRATVLCVILAALALGYAYPVRVYLSQQAEIARMEAGQAEQRERIDDLSAQVVKWQDDAYVVSQARSRLYMVYPGEIPLVVLWDEADSARDAAAAPVTGQTSPPGPWYGKLWSSIEVANH